MTERTRLILYGCFGLLMGTFAAFPYFMSPPVPMNERAWQIGLLQAAGFFLSGWIFAKVYYVQQR